jgi:hypothetical protein
MKPAVFTVICVNKVVCPGAGAQRQTPALYRATHQHKVVTHTPSFILIAVSNGKICPRSITGHRLGGGRDVKVRNVGLNNTKPPATSPTCLLTSLFVSLHKGHFEAKETLRGWCPHLASLFQCHYSQFSTLIMTELC